MSKINFPMEQEQLVKLVSKYNAIHGTDYKVASKRVLDEAVDITVEDRVEGVRQMISDCALIALHDAFGFAEKRVVRYMEAFEARWAWMIQMAGEDYNSVQVPNEKRKQWYLYSPKSEFKTTVPVLLNTQKHVDAELRAICGKHFVPWADRYDDEDYREDNA